MSHYLNRTVTHVLLTEREVIEKDLGSLDSVSLLIDMTCSFNFIDTQLKEKFFPVLNFHNYI